jgi:hypothetical protein
VTGISPWISRFGDWNSAFKEWRLEIRDWIIGGRGGEGTLEIRDWIIGGQRGSRVGRGWEELAMMACCGVWVVWDWKGDGSRNDCPQANGTVVDGEEKDEERTLGIGDLRLGKREA